MFKKTFRNTSERFEAFLIHICFNFRCSDFSTLTPLLRIPQLYAFDIPNDTYDWKAHTVLAIG